MGVAGIGRNCAIAMALLALCLSPSSHAQSVPETIIKKVADALKAFEGDCKITIWNPYTIEGECPRESFLVNGNKLSEKDLLELSLATTNSADARAVVEKLGDYYLGRATPAPDELKEPGYSAEQFEAVKGAPHSGFAFGHLMMPPANWRGEFPFGAAARGYFQCDVIVTEFRVKTGAKDAGAARQIVRDYINKAAGAFQAAKLCGAPPIEVACQAPQVPNAQTINQYLDFLGGLLQVAVERARPETFGLTPNPDLTPVAFTFQHAAAIGRAVWDQARGLQLAALHGEINLTFAQVQRTKAFGHWTDWLQRRVNMGCPPGFICPELPLLPYPFFTNDWLLVKDSIPIPPQLTADADETLIAFQEYSEAAALSIAQAADLYYTKGMMWALYLGMRDRDWRPVVLAALSQIKFVGPTLIAALVSYREYVDFDKLTWDQHMQNITGLYASLLALGLQVTTEPRTAVTMNEPIVESGEKAMRAIGDLLNKSAEALGVPYIRGKSFFIRRRWSVGGKEYADVELGSVGPHKGRPDGAGAPETRTIEVETVKLHVDDSNAAAGEEAFFLKDGTRVVPIGEKGYHAWKHIFERLFGYETGYPSLLSVLQGTAHGAKLAELAAKINDRENIDLGPVNEAYKAIVENLRTDPTYPKFSKYSTQFGAREVNYFMKVKSPCTGQTYYMRLSLGDQAKPGQLNNLFVMDNYTNLPRPLADPVFDWLAIPQSSPLYTGSMQNYVPGNYMRGPR